MKPMWYDLGMTNPPISLREFISEAKDELEVFEKNWRTLAATDPDNWPLSMPIGEWFEQFQIYESPDA